MNKESMIYPEMIAAGANFLSERKICPDATEGAKQLATEIFQTMSEARGPTQYRQQPGDEALIETLSMLPVVCRARTGDAHFLSKESLEWIINRIRTAQPGDIPVSPGMIQAGMLAAHKAAAPYRGDFNAMPMGELVAAIYAAAEAKHRLETLATQ